ncbi:hypothetical protein ATANTOWER_011766 [Ataeniobius toweri]|uniref:Uncharacterized protein n=1 Tax=Ataeniobius toweri TaxID=208326 RepID=A0ABU7B8C3_9TELE|nr:hypothetical protein [Ataeniobius toweri]
MISQTADTYLWAVSPIPLCRSSPAPSGRMGTVSAQPILGFSRNVQLDSNLGSGWATQAYLQSCPEELAICLRSLSCCKMNCYRTGKHIFIEGVLVHCYIYLSLFPDYSQVPVLKSIPPHDVAPMHASLSKRSVAT